MNLGITEDFIRKTCSDAKSDALMAEYAVNGTDYAELNLVESTNFYMNWNATDYRQGICLYAGIDLESCADYTEEEMVEYAWGGPKNAEATKYRVGPLCASPGLKPFIALPCVP